MKQVNMCIDKWHVTPNIVLVSRVLYGLQQKQSPLTCFARQVDWVDIGDAKQARLALNGLS